MTITFDPAKRDWTLASRGLDFADAARVLDGSGFTLVDERADYGEVRYQSYGLLGERQVIVVWTWRGDNRHVISMRKCNAREQARYRSRISRS